MLFFFFNLGKLKLLIKLCDSDEASVIVVLVKYNKFNKVISWR